MPDTTQMNLRMNNELMKDLRFISRALGVKSSEWVKVKLAELIVNEKARLLKRIDDRYVSGKISDSRYEELAGHPPTASLVYQRMAAADGARSYIKSVLKKLEETEASKR